MSSLHLWNLLTADLLCSCLQSAPKAPTQLLETLRRDAAECGLPPEFRAQYETWLVAFQAAQQAPKGGAQAAYTAVSQARQAGVNFGSGTSSSCTAHRVLDCMDLRQWLAHLDTCMPDCA